jgi:uncharacterized membrane protein (DUF2068 family)
MCVLFLVISVGLWLRQPWARVTFLIVGSIFLVFYVVAYNFLQFPCTNHLVDCYPLLILSQPLLTVGALITLVKRFASNNHSGKQ